MRKDTTDTMQDFILYAAKQGSKTPEKYYMVLTTMVYKALFNKVGKKGSAN